jgi:hypothetical protein
MWVKADDKLANHPKILRAGKLIGPDGAILALGFFHWLLSYSAEYLTDGFIGDEIVESCRLCRQPERLAKALCECAVKPGGFALLERADEGYRIHDYHDWQPSAAEAIEFREKKALAGREGGIRSGRVRKQTAKQTDKQNGSTCFADASEVSEANGQANAKQNGSSRARDPVPSRPVRTESRTGGRAPARFQQPVENSGQTTETTATQPRKPRFYIALMHRVLDAYPQETDEGELAEHCKAACARVGAAYDSETIRKALDAALAVRRAAQQSLGPSRHAAGDRPPPDDEVTEADLSAAERRSV